MTKNLFGDKKVIVFDIETTGLDKFYDRIIEVGVLEIRNNRIIREYSKLFGGGKSKIELVNRVHGITDDMRKGKATFEECAEKIVSYFSDSILIGYNIIKFDFPFMQERLKIVNKTIRNVELIDIYLLAKKLKLGSVNLKLETLCKFLNIEYGQHRGLGDAKSTWLLLNKLIEKYNITDKQQLIARKIK